MKKILSIILFSMVVIARGQNTAPDINKSLIPPSPDVAALGKFAIQPVTLYSGMANVSVPVTTIKTTRLSLPISLSYNYNGFRPGEEASSVGLGWALQAGGVITRIVKGHADDDSNIPHKWQDYANILDLATNPDFLAEVGMGHVDTEPDIYIFSFNGNSGKFITVGKRAFLFPKQDLNIVMQDNGAGFYIYAEDGTIYDFHDIETTTPANSGIQPYTSAWYLSQVITDDHTEMISFQYDSWLHRLNAGGYSETYTQQNGGIPQSGGNGMCTIGTCDSWNASIFAGAWVNAKRLVSITSQSAKVNFIAESTQRADINSPSAFALKEIDIYSQPGNTIVKKLILDHGYFGNQAQLKLNAVNTWGFKTIVSGNTTTLDSLNEPPYTFVYNNEQGNYPKITKGIDKWGYYNGKDNNIMLFDETTTGGPLIYPFADRAVHTEACTNGILTRITYPTGGYTAFEYENNMIRMPGVGNNTIENKLSALMVPHSGGNDPNDSTYGYANFNVDYAQTIKVNYSRNVDPVVFPNGTHNFHRLFKLYLQNVDQNGDPLPPTLIYVSPYLHPDLFADSATISLAPGNYMYSVTCDGTSISSTAIVHYTITHLNAYQGDPGPGMRIKAINSYDNIDNTSPAITRSYTYGDGAKFISGPGYGYSVVLHHNDCNNYNMYIHTSDYSSSITTLYADQFYYPSVTEINNDVNGAGKTVYEYTDNQMDAIGVTLSAQTDYAFTNNAFEIVKYKKNTYADWEDGIGPTISFWGFTNAVSEMKDPPHCTPYGPPPLSGSVFDTIPRTVLFQATSYALTSRANYLKSTDEKSYAPGQTNPLTVHTDYYYDNPDYLSPSRTVTQNSKGETITSQVKYPLDYNLTNCTLMSAIDAAFVSARNGIHNTYQYCTSNRYNAAWPKLNPAIQNQYNTELLKELRKWKCEDVCPTNFTPVVGQMNTSLAGLTSCLDPVSHPYNEGAIIVLQRNHMQTPVEQIVSINKSGTEYLQSAVKTDFSFSNTGSSSIFRITPKTLSQTNFLQTPVSKSAFLSNPAAYYQPRVDFKYSNAGNIIEQSKTSDIKESYVWDYNEQYAIAKAINADIPAVAATSFESNGKGNFIFAGTPAPDPMAVTGKQSYSLSGGVISKTDLDPARTYIVSYWSSDVSKNVNGTTGTAGKNIGGYTYYEHKIVNPSGGTITISGTGKIDELRLYPEKAMMTTYTYEPLVGITSQCDVNNNINYYIYDPLCRLILIRDQDKNIIKKFCYSYASQPVNCGVQTIYHNILRYQDFTKNDCPKGYYGSTVTYTVAANVYTSYISQEDADLQAQNDIDANGQNYANAHGTCSLTTCNPFICRGDNKKCVNGVCETGIKVYTGSRFNGTNYTCTYHYEFSDGSWSDPFTEISPIPCM